MQTNEGFELEKREKEAENFISDNGACSKNGPSDGGDCVQTGSHFKDIDLSNDKVTVSTDVSKQDVHEENGDSKKPRYDYLVYLTF